MRREDRSMEILKEINRRPMGDNIPASVSCGGKESIELFTLGTTGTIAPSKPQWSKTPPTVPGYYWLRRKNEKDTVVHVSNWIADDDLQVTFVGNDCSFDIAEVSGEWCGLVEPPK